MGETYTLGNSIFADFDLVLTNTSDRKLKLHFQDCILVEKEAQLERTFMHWGVWKTIALEPIVLKPGKKKRIDLTFIMDKRATPEKIRIEGDWIDLESVNIKKKT